MKAPHVLYGLILLTIISILAGVISSATNTHTTQAQPKKSVLSETTASQGKRKLVDVASNAWHASENRCRKYASTDWPHNKRRRRNLSYSKHRPMQVTPHSKSSAIVPTSETKTAVAVPRGLRKNSRRFVNETKTEKTTANV